MVKSIGVIIEKFIAHFCTQFNNSLDCEILFYDILKLIEKWADYERRNVLFV